MNLDDFLNLPKKKKQPKQRILDKVISLRGQIQVTGGHTEHRSNRCCGKTSYATKEEAEAALTEVRHGKKKRSKKPIRVYKCEFGNWHLTSAPPRFWERGRKQ